MSKATVIPSCPAWCSGAHDLRINATPDYDGDVVHESTPVSVRADRGSRSENRPVKISTETYPDGGATETHTVMEIAGDLLYFSPAAARQLVTALARSIDQMEVTR